MSIHPNESRIQMSVEKLDETGYVDAHCAENIAAAVQTSAEGDLTSISIAFSFVHNQHRTFVNIRI